MGNIRYVCFSDMHLGEEDSLLSNLKAGSMEIDPTKPSPVMTGLVDCLKDLVGKNKGQRPTLILNGDILELALCTTEQALMVFEQFVKLTMPKGDELFKDILYIPGNHDHHLWETAREAQYLTHIKNTKPCGDLEPDRHTTNLFLERQKKMVQSNLLTDLIQRFDNLKDKKINVFYPNLGLRTQNGKRSVLFTHGHYFESKYQLMTDIKGIIFPDQKRPSTVNELEAENFAWIDFFWSTMGRSGQVGEDVEVIYEKLQYPDGIKTIIKDLSIGLARRFDLPGWGDKMEAKIMEFGLNYLIHAMAKGERSKTETSLSQETENGLKEYMTAPLYKQIIGEIESIPEEVTLVFGHTHKAFQRGMEGINRYPAVVDLYNTGGWVVETIVPEPLHGASVVLIDEGLNTVSLKMYNEVTRSQVSVEKVEREEGSNPFYEEIAQLVDPEQNSWKSFSETVSVAVKERAENLEKRVKGRGYVK